MVLVFILKLSELTDIMANSRSYKKLLFAWESWHNNSGIPLRTHYPTFVKLSNTASRGDGKNSTLFMASLVTPKKRLFVLCHIIYHSPVYTLLQPLKISYSH